MKQSCIWFFAAAMAASAPGGAAYPERPVRVIVPFSPGGTADFVARIVAEGLTRTLHQQAVVDNRAGAGSALGTQLAAHATPDGYTLIVTNIALAVNETLRPDRGYVALEVLAPISLVGFTPSVLVVNNNLPFKSLSDWLGAAQRAPGKASFGSAGVGSSTHLSMAYLQSLAKIQLLHVPYKGGGPAVAAMIGGEVNCVMAPIPTVFAHIKAGRLRPLAVSSSKRSATLPDLPTVAEAGVPGYDFNTWYGLLTTAGTPAAVIDRLNRAARAALTAPDLAKKLEAAGLDPQPDSPAEFRKLISDETGKWRAVIQEAGITAR
ncbi:MAG TPA: tripartite tricarboxylate transporter substrate binding protein [Burkholderiales bacterium]|nr:tripartite tricarboxylate transporter substrate binding protein [Burkholderiales bacterium]